jgi:hypothetical protein
MGVKREMIGGSLKKYKRKLLFKGCLTNKFRNNMTGPVNTFAKAKVN